MSGLRVFPNLDVMRPADPEETAAAYAAALDRKDGPTALILTRQNVRTLKEIPVRSERAKAKSVSLSRVSRVGAAAVPRVGGFPRFRQHRVVVAFLFLTPFWLLNDDKQLLGGISLPSPLAGRLGKPITSAAERCYFVCCLPRYFTNHGTGCCGTNLLSAKHLRRLIVPPPRLRLPPAPRPICTTPFVCVYVVSAMHVRHVRKPQVATRRQGTLKGGYVAKKEEGDLELIILAAGSEVQHAIEAAGELGKGVRVVSVPSMYRFDKQSAEYKEEVLPSSCTKRVAMEVRGVACVSQVFCCFVMA